MSSNNDGIFPGETDFRHIEDKLLGGQAQENRQLWARAAANCFQGAPTEVLVAITVAGARAWRDKARITYANHQLRDEDFDLMFDIICRISKDRLERERRVLGVH